MKRKSQLGIVQILILLLFGFFSSAAAQPTDAQLKKQLTSPDTVSLTFGGPGTVEWSSTYKKYVWSRNFTRKLKSDEPGVFIIVKGYASYDVMGGRYVYWRNFISSNSYEGKKNPTVSEINQALETVGLSKYGRPGDIIGEYESLKMADAPNWEWHSPNSASFYTVAVYRVINRGKSYAGTPSHQAAAGFRTIDRVQEIWRLRIYRKDEKSPWHSATTLVVPTLKIPNAKGEMIDRLKLLERKDYREEEIQRMPRATKAPLLTQ